MRKLREENKIAPSKNVEHRCKEKGNKMFSALSITKGLELSKKQTRLVLDFFLFEDFFMFVCFLSTGIDYRVFIIAGL